MVVSEISLATDEDVLMHLDDCDLYYRKFWIYVQHRKLIRVRKTSTGSMKDAVEALRKLRYGFGKELAKGYRLVDMTMESKPRPRYRANRSGKREFSHYDSDTWVYTVTIEGDRA